MLSSGSISAMLQISVNEKKFYHMINHIGLRKIRRNELLLGSVYTGPTEYLVAQIFGHLGVAFTRGRLTDLKLGHLGVQIFGRLAGQVPDDPV